MMVYIIVFTLLMACGASFLQFNWKVEHISDDGVKEYGRYFFHDGGHEEIDLSRDSDLTIEIWIGTDETKKLSADKIKWKFHQSQDETLRYTAEPELQEKSADDGWIVVESDESKVTNHKWKFKPIGLRFSEDPNKMSIEEMNLYLKNQWRTPINDIYITLDGGPEFQDRSWKWMQEFVHRMHRLHAKTPPSFIIHPSFGIFNTVDQIEIISFTAWPDITVGGSITPDDTIRFVRVSGTTAILDEEWVYTGTNTWKLIRHTGSGTGTKNSQQIVEYAQQKSKADQHVYYGHHLGRHWFFLEIKPGFHDFEDIYDHPLVDFNTDIYIQFGKEIRKYNMHKRKKLEQSTQAASNSNSVPKARTEMNNYGEFIDYNMWNNYRPIDFYVAGFQYGIRTAMRKKRKSRLFGKYYS